MKQLYHDEIRSQFGLTEVQMDILKPYLDEAFNKASEPADWLLQCLEVKKHENPVTLENAKQDLLNAIVDTATRMMVHNMVKKELPEEIFDKQIAKESDCLDCGGPVLMGVCQWCNQ